MRTLIPALALSLLACSSQSEQRPAESPASTTTITQAPAPPTKASPAVSLVYSQTAFDTQVEEDLRKMNAMLVTIRMNTEKLENVDRTSILEKVTRAESDLQRAASLARSQGPDVAAHQSDVTAALKQLYQSVDNARNSYTSALTVSTRSKEGQPLPPP